jgi:hypothetical protein
MAVVAAGRGDDLPYHAQWSTTNSMEKVHAEFIERLEGSPKWQVTHTPAGDALVTTMVRVDSFGYMTHFARVTIERDLAQTFFTVEFTPVPSSLAPD